MPGTPFGGGQQQQQQQIGNIPPSTPYSTALGNFKWYNAHSKTEKTPRIDEMMERISEGFKEKITEEIMNVTTEVFAVKGGTASLAAVYTAGELLSNDT